MADYYDSERVTDLRHCGSSAEHSQHGWWESRGGHHACTGNVMTVNWPARAYAYGTRVYALNRARELAGRHAQRMHVYPGVLDGERVWVASWDPRKTDDKGIAQ